MHTRQFAPALLLLSSCIFHTSGLSSGTTGSGGDGGGGDTSSSGSTGGASSSNGGSGGTGGTSSSTGGSGGTGGMATCNDGDTQSCYSGPPGSKGVGACKGGQQTCSNKEWGPCEGEIVPVVDSICDGIDADCDGDDDEVEGCATFEVTDSCQGVLLLKGGTVVVPEGSSPNNPACYDGTVKWYIEAGDDLYILEDDSETTVRVKNAQPLTIEGKVQISTALFDHASMQSQYNFGGFSANGLTQTVTPVSGGNDYNVIHKPSAERTSFVFSF